MRRGWCASQVVVVTRRRSLPRRLDAGVSRSRVSSRGAVTRAPAAGPLAELVKIYPKSRSVGAVSHDVHQRPKGPLDLTWRSLESPLLWKEHRIGRRSATSPASDQYATGIVALRDPSRSPPSTNDLKEVPRLGAKAFEQGPFSSRAAAVCSAGCECVAIPSATRRVADGCRPRCGLAKKKSHGNDAHSWTRFHSRSPPPDFDADAACIVARQKQGASTRAFEPPLSARQSPSHQTWRRAWCWNARHQHRRIRLLLRYGVHRMAGHVSHSRTVLQGSAMIVRSASAEFTVQCVDLARGHRAHDAYRSALYTSVKIAESCIDSSRQRRRGCAMRTEGISARTRRRGAFESSVRSAKGTVAPNAFASSKTLSVARASAYSGRA